MNGNPKTNAIGLLQSETFSPYDM